MSQQDYTVGDIVYYTQKAQYRGLRQVRITQVDPGRNGTVRGYYGDVIQAAGVPAAVGERIYLIVSHMTKNYEVALRRMRKQITKTRREYRSNREWMDRYEAEMQELEKAAEEMLI